MAHKYLNGLATGSHTSVSFLIILSVFLPTIVLRGSSNMAGTSPLASSPLLFTPDAGNANAHFLQDFLKCLPSEGPSLLTHCGADPHSSPSFIRFLHIFHLPNRMCILRAETVFYVCLSVLSPRTILSTR